MEKLPFSTRFSLLANADGIFAEAKNRLPIAEVENPSSQVWLDLAEDFKRAGQYYRQADLGLMSRRAFEYASRCYREAGDIDASDRCGARAKCIPAYWEEAGDE